MLSKYWIRQAIPNGLEISVESGQAFQRSVSRSDRARPLPLGRIVGNPDFWPALHGRRVRSADWT